MSSQEDSLPLLRKDSVFSLWQSDAKAYLRRKEVFGPCLTASTDVVANEKCVGILWGMLSADVKPLVKQHEDDPKALWDALATIYAPKKAGARFNAYRTLTSIHLREDENLLDLTGRVSSAMRLLKDSRSNNFTLDQADEELQAVVLLMALPDDGLYSVLRAPFEQSADLLKVSKVEEAFANHVAFRTGRQEADSGQNPVSGLTMTTVATPTPNVVPSSSAATATTPTVQADKCPACGRTGHNLLSCFKFLRLIGKEVPQSKGADAKSQVASNASLLLYPALVFVDKCWVSDSGCTSHMTPHKERLLNPKPYRVPITVANGVIVYSELVGEVLLWPLLNGLYTRPVILTHVLYVPSLSHNLISTTYLSRVHGYSIEMKDCIISFIHNGVLVFEADIDERNQAYVREANSTSVSALATSSTLPLDLNLLHRRLGHHNDVKKMLRKNLVTGAKLTSNQMPDPICEPCLAGKLNAAPFPSTGHRASAPLDLIHSDLKQYKVFTREGWKHRVVFADDHTGFKLAIHMKHKSGTFQAFKRFKAYAENHFGRKIKALQEDEGEEYMSTEFAKFLADEGIVRRHSTRNRPQQNGTAERANRTIDEHVTAMLHEANLPPSFKALAVDAYLHVANMHPTVHIGDSTTPYELWHKQKPDVSHLRVWAALPMCMCRKTRETILEYISRGASLLVIQLSTRGGDFTTPSQDNWLLESVRSLMNATSLATTLLYWIVVQTPLSSHSSICLIRHQRYPLNLWLYVMTGEMTSLVSMHLLQLHPSHYLPHPRHPFQVALPLLTLWHFPTHRLLHHLLSNHLHHPQLVLLHATAFMNRKLNTSRQQNGGNCPRHLLLLSLTMSQRTVMMNCCCNQGVYWLLPMKGILPVLNCRLPMLLQCTRFTLLSTLAIPDHIMKQ